MIVYLEAALAALAVASAAILVACIVSVIRGLFRPRPND